jgi:hypothetical protein
MHVDIQKELQLLLLYFVRPLQHLLFHQHIQRLPHKEIAFVSVDVLLFRDDVEFLLENLFLTL